jgi:hypothetical protein
MHSMGQGEVALHAWGLIWDYSHPAGTHTNKNATGKWRCSTVDHAAVVGSCKCCLPDLPEPVPACNCPCLQLSLPETVQFTA